MDSGGMPEDWTPPEPPKHGDCRWKDTRALDYCIEKRLLDKTAIVRLPVCDGIDLGYMAIQYFSGSGTNYFRVDEVSQ